MSGRKSGCSCQDTVNIKDNAKLKADRQKKRARQLANKIYDVKLELVNQKTMNKIMNLRSNMRTIAHQVKYTLRKTSHCVSVWSLFI